MRHNIRLLDVVMGSNKARIVRAGHQVCVFGHQQAHSLSLGPGAWLLHDNSGKVVVHIYACGTGGAFSSNVPCGG